MIARRESRQLRYNAAIKGRKLSVKTRYKIWDKLKVSWQPCGKCKKEFRHTDLIFRPFWEPKDEWYHLNDEDEKDFFYVCINDKKDYEKLCKVCFDFLLNGKQLEFKN